MSFAVVLTHQIPLQQHVFTIALVRVVLTLPLVMCISDGNVSHVSSVISFTQYT